MSGWPHAHAAGYGDIPHAESPVGHYFRSIAVVASVFALVLGASLPLSWALNFGAPGSTLPPSLSINANTAALFIVCGLSLLLQIEFGFVAKAPFIARICACLTIAIASLALFDDDATGRLGIDPSGPARISINAALAFVALGIALLLVTLKSNVARVISQGLLVLTILVSFLAVTGDAFRAPALTGLAGYTTMALHTAVGVLVLAVGALASRTDSGISAILAQDNLAGSAIRRLLPVFLVVPFVLGLLLLWGQNAGLYESEFGLALMVVTSTSIVATLIVWHAGTQGAAEDVRLRTIGDELFVHAIGEIFRTSFSRDDATHRITSRLGNYLGVARCFFSEAGSDNSEAIANDFHQGQASLVGTEAMSWTCPSTIGVTDGAHTTVIDDSSADSRSLARYETTYRPAGIGAFVAVELPRDKLWAAIFFVGVQQARVWHKKEIALIRAVAEKLWIEFEHGRLSSAVQGHQIRDAVRESEERLNLVVESIRDHAIFLLDEKGYVLTWNASAERLQGYGANEILGKHFSVFFGEEDTSLGGPVRELERAVATGRYEEDGWRVRKDGTRFWANIVITALRDKNGAVQGFIKIARDFTQRRLAEQEILHSQAQLRSALKEREVLLLEVQHRVKNNLQVISSLMSLQARHVDDASAQNALTECRGRIESIALIHEKLDQSNDSARVPFSDYTKGLAINVFQALGVSPESVTLQLELETVSLAVDRAVSCGLILNELITNALKHAFPGDRSGVVRIELRQVEGDVRLTVRDDGVGMSADVDPGKTKSLGMQLVLTLVAQLDGKLEVDRRGGTAIGVTFPMEAR